MNVPMARVTQPEPRAVVSDASVAALWTIAGALAVIAMILGIMAMCALLFLLGGTLDVRIVSGR